MKLLRWDTQEIIFELECSNWKELLEGAIKAKISLYRANLRSADLRSANLRSADLSDANLSDADLRSADLSDANLSDADLRSANGNLKELKTIKIETYSITFTASVMQIGCQRHDIEKWKNFSDDDILNMDGKTALKFWRKWKDLIFNAIELSFEKGEQ